MRLCIDGFPVIKECLQSDSEQACGCIGRIAGKAILDLDLASPENVNLLWLTFDFRCQRCAIVEEMITTSARRGSGT